MKSALFVALTALFCVSASVATERTLAFATTDTMGTVVCPPPIPPVGTECLRVIVSLPGTIIATYEGNSASFSNDLFLMLDAAGNPGDDGDPTNDRFIFNNHESPCGSTANLDSFPVGTELIFRLRVRNTGKNWYTGPAERNEDRRCRARVQGNWRPNRTLVSFEDHVDFVYNDLSFSFTNTGSLTCSDGTALVGVAYSSALVASGGTPPYTFSIVVGDLPAGLVLNTATGQIAGTPTTAGVFSFTASATDANSVVASANCAITVLPQVGITLTPHDATNVVGTQHTVTARCADELDNPQPGTQVTFTVVSGPNAGASGTCSANADCATDSNGRVSFTYTGSGGVGTDSVRACFTDQTIRKCDQVTKTWIVACPSLQSLQEALEGYFGNGCVDSGSDTGAEVFRGYGFQFVLIQKCGNWELGWYPTDQPAEFHRIFAPGDPEGRVVTLLISAPFFGLRTRGSEEWSTQTGLNSDGFDHWETFDVCNNFGGLAAGVEGSTGGGDQGHQEYVIFFRAGPVPVTMQDLAAEASPQQVRLSWRLQGAPLVEVALVFVERSQDASGPYVRLGALRPEPSMQFEDGLVEAGRTYWYRIVLESPGSGLTVAGSIHVAVPARAWRHELLVPALVRGSDPVVMTYRIGGEGGVVRLEVYNVAGVLVRRLENGARAPGEYLARWDLRTEWGQGAPRGMYLVKLAVREHTLLKKMVLIR